MSCSDGACDEASEALTVNVDTTGWAAGTYRLFIDAKDAAGNWGPASAVYIDVDVSPEDGVGVTGSLP
jgi:hypothetical protein